MTEEVKTSFYMRKEIIKALKHKAVDDDSSLKELMTRYAIEGLRRDGKF